MVETLLSLVLLLAAISLAIWPSISMHDHTIDGLFLTLTGSMLTLLFLFNFIWQLRFQGAKEVTAVRQACERWARAVRTVFSKGGRDMRTIPPRISIPLAMGTVLLLILAFPSSLYANDLPLVRQNSITRQSRILSVVVPGGSPSRAIVSNRQLSDHGLLLMDADFRLRAAAAFVGNPAIEKSAENSRVNLKVIVIAPGPLLDV
jgi:hypothetical protein